MQGSKLIEVVLRNLWYCPQAHDLPVRAHAERLAGSGHLDDYLRENPIIIARYRNRFMVNDGYRRCYASLIAGRKTVPAILDTLQIYAPQEGDELYRLTEGPFYKHCMKNQK